MNDQLVCGIFYLYTGSNSVWVSHERGDAMYQLEMPQAGCSQLYEHLIGDAQNFQGVIVYTPLHVFIGHAIDIHLAIYSFIGGRVLVVRQMCNGYFNGDELGLVVLEPVQSGFQLPAGPVLHEAGQGAVTHRVKEEYPHQQYGSKISQADVK